METHYSLVKQHSCLRIQVIPLSGAFLSSGEGLVLRKYAVQTNMGYCVTHYIVTKKEKEQRDQCFLTRVYFVFIRPVVNKYKNVCTCSVNA